MSEPTPALRVCGVLCAVTVGMVACPTAALCDPILVNGSFEIGPPPFGNQDIDILPGSADILGWTITGAGVDLLEDPWDVSDGLRAIDLDGRSPGGIAQTIATSVGGLYSVAFDVSGNPGGPLLKAFRVTVGDFAQDYEFDSSGQALDALIWQTIAFSFVAWGETSTLQFASLSVEGNAYGALIDNVAVSAVSTPTPVPEPATAVMFGSGFALAVLSSFRRRRLSRRFEERF